MSRIVAATVATILGLFALTIIFGSWYTVDQGYRGVILRNGAVTGVAQPGLGFKMPLIDTVLDISVQEQIRLYGQEVGLSTYSRDQQPAELRVSVNYSIPADKVTEVYAEFGGADGLVTRILDPRVNQQVKNVFGQFNAVTAIQDRARLNIDIREALEKSVEGQPIVIGGVQIENIDFSNAYEESIEQRMQAEVEVQKLKQNADREKIQAEIVVIKANAEANATRARAEAEGAAITIRGKAEGDAIRSKGEALRDNPSLVALIQAERWNGVLPTTMVPNSTVPFLSMGQSAP